MSRSVLVVTAAALCALAATPSLAVAAPSMSISVEPAVPAKGKPFQMIVRGTAEAPGGASSLKVTLKGGTAGCASTARLESAGDDDVSYEEHIDGNIAFDRRIVFGGDSGAPFDLKNGAKTGKYHVCAYLEDTNTSPVTHLVSRLAFTVGGTCASASAKVTKAKKALKRASKALKRAKKAYSSDPSAANLKRVKKAKAKVKKAKRKLKAAKSDRKALC